MDDFLKVIDPYPFTPTTFGSNIVLVRYFRPAIFTKSEAILSLRSKAMKQQVHRGLTLGSRVHTKSL